MREISVTTDDVINLVEVVSNIPTEQLQFRGEGHESIMATIYSVKAQMKNSKPGDWVSLTVKA